MRMELLITFLIASFIFFLFLLLNIKTNHQLELQQWVVAPKIESRVLDRLQANVENKLSIKQEQDFFDTPQQLIERLAEKSLEKRLVLLTKTVTTDKEPSEAELLEFFKLNREDYRDNSLVSLRQVTYAISARGGRAYEAAMKDLSASKRGITPTGDQNPLLNHYERVTSVDLEELFGEDAGNKIVALASNTQSLPSWIGPIRSVHGFHLIYVEFFELGPLPSLDEVRFQVINDWRNSGSNLN